MHCLFLSAKLWTYTRQLCLISADLFIHLWKCIEILEQTEARPFIWSAYQCMFQTFWYIMSAVSSDIFYGNHRHMTRRQLGIICPSSAQIFHIFWPSFAPEQGTLTVSSQYNITCLPRRSLLPSQSICRWLILEMPCQYARTMEERWKWLLKNWHSC